MDFAKMNFATYFFLSIFIYYGTFLIGFNIGLCLGYVYDYLCDRRRNIYEEIGDELTNNRYNRVANNV